MSARHAHVIAGEDDQGAPVYQPVCFDHPDTWNGANSYDEGTAVSNARIHDTDHHSAEVCTGCRMLIGTPGVTHKSATKFGCHWVDCGHHAARGSDRCHHIAHSQRPIQTVTTTQQMEGTFMSDETDPEAPPPVAPLTPPKTRTRRAATPPPIEGMREATPPPAPTWLTESQHRHLEALLAAKSLLGRDVTANELLSLARWIVNGSQNDILDRVENALDIEPAFTFTNPTSTEGTIQ